MGQVEITAGKIKSDFCDYSYEERTENGTQTVNVSCETIIHDDMRHKFRQLVPHLAFICEEVSKSKSLDDAIDDVFDLSDADPLLEKLQSFKVTGFKIGGSGDSQGVAISGQKKLKNGKVLNLNTPFMKWEDEYEYAQELRLAVSNCQNEIIEYSDGKKAPDAQMSLFDDGEELELGEDI